MDRYYKRLKRQSNYWGDYESISLSKHSLLLTIAGLRNITEQKTDTRMTLIMPLGLVNTYKELIKPRFQRRQEKQERYRV